VPPRAETWRTARRIELRIDRFAQAARSPFPLPSSIWWVEQDLNLQAPQEQPGYGRLVFTHHAFNPKPGGPREIRTPMPKQRFLRTPCIPVPLSAPIKRPPDCDEPGGLCLPLGCRPSPHPHTTSLAISAIGRRARQASWIAVASSSKHHSSNWNRHSDSNRGPCP